MGLLDKILLKKGAKFTFKKHNGEERTMRAKDIYEIIIGQSKDSDYNWMAPAIELVKLCKNQEFPIEYAVDIEVAILNCFANIEARVNRGGDKYATKENDAIAVQYCYDELGRLAQSTDDEELKNTIRTVRTRYLKEMISSAVNTSTRYVYFHCKAFIDLKEEVISRNFVKYSMMEEDFNILDMYEEIYDETDRIFREAYESGMFKQAEDESTFRLLGMFDDIDPLIIPHPQYARATFKGDHIKNYVQEIAQPSREEDIVEK